MPEAKSLTASNVIDGFVLVLALTIILDVWVGYFGLLSGIIPVLAAGLVFFIFLKRPFFSPPTIPEKISPIVWRAVLFVATGAGLVLFGVQHGFDLSADAAPVFAAQQITNRIPLTYPAPINLLFFYPLGLPVLVSQFSFIPIPLHQLAWGLGLIGLLMMFLYFPRVGELKKISAIGLALIPLFLLGTRLPFLSLLAGEYPLLLSVGLGMAAWAWIERDSLLAALALGASFLSHPYGGMVLLLAILLTQKIGKKEMGALVVAIIVTLPMLFFQFLPYIQSDKLNAAAGTIHLGTGDLTAMFFLIGIIPLFFWGAGLLIRFFRKRTVWDENLRCAAILFLVGAGGYVIGLQFPFFVIGSKLLLLAAFGAVLGAAHEWSMILSQKNWKWAGIIIIIASMALLAASGDIRHLVNGSKSTIEEAQFASRMVGKIPAGSAVLFLSPSQGKMGEYSHTIPPDIFTTHYLTSVLWKNSTSPTVSQLQKEAEESKSILKEKCVPCVANYAGDYIVVNTRVFPELKKYPVLYQDNGFILYRNNPILPIIQNE